MPSPVLRASSLTPSRFGALSILWASASLAACFADTNTRSRGSEAGVGGTDGDDTVAGPGTSGGGSGGTSVSSSVGSGGDTTAGSTGGRTASSEGPTASGGTGAPTGATVRLHLTASAAPSTMKGSAPDVFGAALRGVRAFRPRGFAGFMPRRDAVSPPACTGPTTPIGQATAAELESLRYYVRSIQICGEVETQGTGYSNTQDCIDLYQAEVQENYDTFLADEARAHPEHYIDLMDPASLTRLNQEVALPPDAARAYKYGLINWYRPVIVRATVPLSAGGGTPVTLHTQDGDVVGDAMDPMYGTNVVDDLTVSPAADGVALLNNGGTWFRFQRPFVVTEADLTQGTSFALDLVFNPDRIVSGMHCTTRGVAFSDAAGHGIFVPMLDLSPVPRRATETTLRESYLLHLTAEDISNPFDIRLELYSIAEDSERSIYGVDVKGIIASGTTSEPMTNKVSFLVTNGDETLEFQDYRELPMFVGFKRLSAPGETGTVEIPCNGSIASLTEAACTGSLLADYELVSSGPL